MTSPLFSICIAAYNADRLIGDCLRSVAAQDCRDYEVIVVDDGSAEPLVLDEGIRSSLPSCTLKRTANCGPYAARQAAFDIARGDVILCIDADDELICHDALTKLRGAFAEGADIVLFNASSSKCTPSGVFDFSALGGDGRIGEAAVWDLYTKGYSLNSLCCKAFKRSLYTKGDKERPRLLMAEDRLQSLEVMRNASSYWLVDEPLYYYRPNSDSTTHAGYDPAYYRQACYVEEEVVEFMAGRGMPLADWARYFLGYTSSALLGVRYNRLLDAAARHRAYASARDERVLGIARENGGMAGLSRVDALRLSLLFDGKFAALDVCMLPWRIGSGLKGALRDMRRGTAV